MTFPLQRKTLLRPVAALALGLGVSALLGGCGGASSSTQSFAAYTANGPVAFGLSAAGVNSNPVQYVETSGAISPDDGTAYAVAAVASTALPVPGETTAAGTIPLGFSPGAVYIDRTSFGQALRPGGKFVFGTYIANGLDTSGNFIAISNITLSSADLDITSQTLTYAPRYNGPLVNAQYKTGALTIPAGATTGLKQLTATVNDASPNADRHSPSTTTYDMVVLAGSDSAVLAQIVDAKGAPIAGATATIDGADAPGYVGDGQAAGASTDSISDTQGMVLLFAPAGVHTVTVTSGKDTGTLALTTFPGFLTGTTTNGAPSTPTSDTSSKAQIAGLAIPVPTPVPPSK